MCSSDVAFEDLLPDYVFSENEMKVYVLLSAEILLSEMVYFVLESS